MVLRSRLEQNFLEIRCNFPTHRLPRRWEITESSPFNVNLFARSAGPETKNKVFRDVALTLGRLGVVILAQAAIRFATIEGSVALFSPTETVVVLHRKSDGPP